jgi:hypothetical protein
MNQLMTALRQRIGELLHGCKKSTYFLNVMPGAIYLPPALIVRLNKPWPRLFV